MKWLFFFYMISIATVVHAQVGGYIVAADGSGDFRTVQEAFDAVPLNNEKPMTIFVRNGVYKGKLHLIAGKTRVKLVGESQEGAIITYDDHSGRITSAGITINTATSYTLKIDADDFTAEQITIQNNAGFTAGQAVSVMVNGDRCRFIDCRITGFQDTLFLSSGKSRCYFSKCFIDGTTDFIFGDATALFENCTIVSKKNSHITAASTPLTNSFGFVFKHCRFTAADSVSKVTLGRPWKPFASVTYFRCYLGDHIIPAGWDNWRNPENEKTARYAEFENYGPGAKRSSRVPWSVQLTAAQANQLTTKNILTGWNPHQAK
jgi:pectinesterase